MGVMACSRKECESIMCDTYVDGIGYVCQECQEEFKKYCTSLTITFNVKSEIETSFRIFMDNSVKGEHSNEEMSIDDYFNNYKSQ